MKKFNSLIILAIFALVAMMFVSCSAEVAKAADDLVYASFDDAAKALSYSYDLPTYSGLYWQYSAYKTDNYGASGATWNGAENEAFVPVSKDSNNNVITGYEGKVGPFSQGSWHFKLQGYADTSFTKLIYEGEADAKLKKNQTNYIAVTIHDASLTGAIVFDNAYFEWEEVTSETGLLELSIYMSGTNLNHRYTYTETLTQGGAPDYRYYFAGDANHIMKPSENAVQVNEVASDLYTVTVEVRTTDGDLVFADQNLAMQVYGGINNVITGDLIEGLSEENYFAEPVHERDADSPYLNGVFSVAAEKQVKFSKGNLYYDGSDWGFEDNQYDFRTKNGYASVKDGEYSDTGTENGNLGLFFWIQSTDDASTGTFTFSNITNTDQFFLDVNPVMGEEWFTLTNDEWIYLTTSRSDASSKKGLATINTGSYEVTGLVFLPDSWTLPDGCSWTAGYENEYATNSYTAIQWAAMEAAGAVFLPASGYIFNVNDMSSVQIAAGYWSSTMSSDIYGSALRLWFNKWQGDSISKGNRSSGLAIRLVQLYQD